MMLQSAFKFMVIVLSTCLSIKIPAAPSPLRILLITGGCCHDYAHQKDILKKGIEARVNAAITQMHTDDASTRPPLAIVGNPDYATGYDLVIHDECGSDISEPETIK